MATKHYKAGEIIIAEGEEGDSAFLIESGTVQVSILSGERKRDLAELGKGEVFGEMSLIDPGPRSATVTAVTDTQCLVTTFDEFMDLVNQHPAQAIRYMRTLVQRLRQMNEMLANAGPARRRIIDVLREWGSPPSRDGSGMSEEEWREHMERTMMYTPLF